MDLNEAFDYASEHSRVVRQRKNPLYTFGVTRLPYFCYSESPEQSDMVVVNSGEVTAEPPRIALPGQPFRFDGFEDYEEEDLARVLIARRIQIPQAQYTNRQDPSSLEKGPLDEVIERAVNRLDQASDSRTAVISAPHTVWSLSVLMYVGSQIVRSAPSNVAEHFEHLRLQNGE